MKEMRFWPENEEKILIFSRCIHLSDLVLKTCSGINEEIWIQLPFKFSTVVNIGASLVEMSLFICGSRFRLKFSRIALLRKRLQMDSKSDFTRKG